MKKTEFIFSVVAAVFILLSILGKIETASTLSIQYVHLDNINQVIDIEDSLVVPVLYDSIIINTFAPTIERKKQFINQVLPAILVVRFQMENKSRKVNRIMRKLEEGKELKSKEKLYVDSLMTKFRAKSHENLLLRLKPHPTSLVLAQAAVESGWGSSRFALEGNNLFGIWTTPNDPNVIKSMYDRGDQSIFVKKYPNIAASIDHYFLTLGRHNAYRNFRSQRNLEVDVFQLIGTLDKYSERGDEYTELLKKMVEWNHLQQYDRYFIDPAFIIQESFYQKLFNKLK